MSWIKFLSASIRVSAIIFLAAVFIAAVPIKPAAAAEYYEVSLNSLVFVDTEIQKVLEIFSKMTRANLFLDESVPRKKITFFAQNMPVKLALEMFVKTNGLMLKKMNSNTFLIFPKLKAADYESELSSHVFILENDDPKKIINILKTIGKNTKVSLNERINGIVMIDTPENIETAKKIVASMDYKKPQVTVDLKLVEIKRDRLKDLGVKFKNDSNMIINLKSLATLKDQVLIDTLIKENAAEVLAQPKLKVLDQQKAEIQVGDKIPIEITSASKTAAGDSVQLNKTVQWESVGIKLQVQVEKIHNANEVTLKIYNEVSSVVEYTKEGYPHIRTRNAVTVVRLSSSETAVIGGLINSEERTTVFKIPLLSTLPGLGKIFRNVRTDKMSTEIVMFITPVISTEPSMDKVENMEADLLEKTENRSAAISSNSLNVMDKNTDYYFGAPDRPSLGCENAVSLPEFTAEVKLMPAAAPVTDEIKISDAPAIDFKRAAVETADAPPQRQTGTASIELIPSPDHVYTKEIELFKDTAPASQAVELQYASAVTAENKIPARSDYNEKLKQILNRIREARKAISSDTSAVNIN
ncbi:MAG TPA: type II and III secretion system protein [Candidatus Wallbacteria bacterium]|nr:type II and III secretion system protein [Candidatus Wallbacteria bacterium]